MYHWLFTSFHVKGCSPLIDIVGVFTRQGSQVQSLSRPPITSEIQHEPPTGALAALCSYLAPHYIRNRHQRRAGDRRPWHRSGTDQPHIRLGKIPPRSRPAARRPQVRNPCARIRPRPPACHRRARSLSTNTPCLCQTNGKIVIENNNPMAIL